MVRVNKKVKVLVIYKLLLFFFLEMLILSRFGLIRIVIYNIKMIGKDFIR